MTIKEPEKKCEKCGGTGELSTRNVGVWDIHELCPACKGTGKLPPITVEQTIKKVME